MTSPSAHIPAERIECRIHLIRGQRVMLDSDLARLYGVPTKSLNLAVKRNPRRFPDGFMFRLAAKEWESLRLQFETSKAGRGGRRTPPYAFTEHGVAMLSSVLNSERAIEANIAIIKTFVRLREMIVSNKVLAATLAELEAKVENQGKDVRTLFAAIHQLMTPPPEPPRRRIGFCVEKD